MTDKEKQLLLVDLCARLPYGVKGILKDDDTADYNVLEVLLEGICGTTTLIGCEKDMVHFSWDIELFKPYLRPMSSMTEEERCEIRKYCENNDNFKLIHDIGVSGQIYCSIIIEYLNKNMFDYRGLIPMGLALEAPKNMYKEK